VPERHSHDLTIGVVPDAGLLGHALWDMAPSCHSINICIFGTVPTLSNVYICSSGRQQRLLRLTMCPFMCVRTIAHAGRQLQKSMQWNIIGILTLTIGLSLGMTLLYKNAVLMIGEFYIYLENSFTIIFSITSGFMCFVFALFHGFSQLFS